jgi:hypothetical protein
MPHTSSKHLPALRSLPTIFDYLNLADSLSYIFTSKQAYQLFREYCGDHVNSRMFDSYLAFIKDPEPLVYTFIRFIKLAVEKDKKLQLVEHLEIMPWYLKLFNTKINSLLRDPSLKEMIIELKVDSTPIYRSVNTIPIVFSVWCFAVILRLQPDVFVQFLEVAEKIPGNIMITKEMMLNLLETANNFLNTIFFTTPQNNYWFFSGLMR